MFWRALLSLWLLATVAAVPADITAAAASRQQRPPVTGLLIRGGDIIDGTGSAARRADIRTAGDTIVEIGAHLQAKAGERVIEADGKVASPGFIDIHAHVDGEIVERLDAEDQVRQGITTSVGGNCGGSQLPLSEFLDTLDRRRPAINIVELVGHGTVRELVMGGDYKRPATAAEIEVMKALVNRAMQDGAAGLSSGLEYQSRLLRQAGGTGRAGRRRRTLRRVLRQSRPQRDRLGVRRVARGDRRWPQGPCAGRDLALQAGLQTGLGQRH